MTTTPDSSNKTALRASLRKEDESLAERLAEAEVPLVPVGPPDLPVAAVSSAEPVPEPPAGKPAAGRRGKAVAKMKSSAKSERHAADTKPVGSKKGARRASRAKAAEKGAASSQASEVVQKADKPAKSGAVAPALRSESASRTAKIDEAVEKLGKAAREKGDKLVRYSVELLKSEEAAIEALRTELSKAAGWATSKSDILRAGIRVFAEQKVERMKEVLASLASLSKVKKKG
ncbi:hypothetical protein [Accumulibacter sp.]|uniref:hypothetical protein n=2 Tax=Accumulibacter sp. TaxID=2053492 RepID=UPI0025DF2C57|nr:hypothetical protein [Accumulibacter sp.]MCM8624646.1 hypothetical protein [Accumulibacter sp.]